MNCLGDSQDSDYQISATRGAHPEKILNPVTFRLNGLCRPTE